MSYFIRRKQVISRFKNVWQMFGLLTTWMNWFPWKWGGSCYKFHRKIVNRPTRANRLTRVSICTCPKRTIVTIFYVNISSTPLLFLFFCHFAFFVGHFLIKIPYNFSTLAKNVCKLLHKRIRFKIWRTHFWRSVPNFLGDLQKFWTKIINLLRDKAKKCDCCFGDACLCPMSPHLLSKSHQFTKKIDEEGGRIQSMVLQSQHRSDRTDSVFHQIRKECFPLYVFLAK